jgi:chromosome segregation ATPase
MGTVITPTRLVSDTQVDAHEDRIQRLEDTRTEIKTELAEQTVRLEVLARCVETGLQSVVEKIDCTVGPLVSSMNQVVEQVRQHETKLGTLESKETAREQAWIAKIGTVKKWIFAALLAVGGALGKEFGTYLWQYFHR